MIKKLSLTIMALLLCTSAVLAKELKMYQGLGGTTNFRVGPGKDSEGVQVYSFNYVDAAVIFDADGKIVNAIVDTLEVSSPNYDGASMPHFSGWPGTEGYNVSDHTTAKVAGKSENTEEMIANEVNSWKSKRERGSSYGMSPKNKEWDVQMDHFQKMFVGKTVAELEEDFKMLYSDMNGRPLNVNNKRDKQKYDKLTDAQKAEVADLVAGATMSIRDSHGDILGAIKKAYENRIEFTVVSE